MKSITRSATAFMFLSAASRCVKPWMTEHHRRLPIMKTTKFPIVALAFLLGAPLAAAQGVSVDINFGAFPPDVAAPPEPFVQYVAPTDFSAAPELVVVPSGESYVYMVPDMVGMYFYGGYWYRYFDGYWYLANFYNGPWGYIATGLVPAVVLGIPPEYPRFLPPWYHRVHYRDLHHHWREWDQRRSWHRHEWFRREMRDEMRRERFAEIERRRGPRDAGPGMRGTPSVPPGTQRTPGTPGFGPGAAGFPGTRAPGAQGAAPGTPGALTGPGLLGLPGTRTPGTSTGPGLLGLQGNQKPPVIGSTPGSIGTPGATPTTPRAPASPGAAPGMRGNAAGAGPFALTPKTPRIPTNPGSAPGTQRAPTGPGATPTTPRTPANVGGPPGTLRIPTNPGTAPATPRTSPTPGAPSTPRGNFGAGAAAQPARSRT